MDEFGFIPKEFVNNCKIYIFSVIALLMATTFILCYFWLVRFSLSACWSSSSVKRQSRQYFGTARLDDHNILLIGGSEISVNTVNPLNEMTLFNTKHSNFSHYGILPPQMPTSYRPTSITKLG